MAYKFQPGALVRVREDAELSAAQMRHAGRVGSIDHLDESRSEPTYRVDFGAPWDFAYLHEEFLELVNECQPDFDGV